jgi:hypothetical protein
MHIRLVAKAAKHGMEALIAEYLATKQVTRAEAATARGAKQPKTKHAGKPNYGMKARRYA